MKIADVFKSIFYRTNEAVRKTYNTLDVKELRPNEFTLSQQGRYVIARYPFPLESLFYFSYHSDILSTIHFALRREMFRNGFELVETKKTDSEQQTESMNEQDVDNTEIDELLEKLKKVNNNNQSIIDLAYELEDDLNIIDDAFLLVLYDYKFKGKEIDFENSEPMEFLRADPRSMYKVMNQRDMYGFDDSMKPLLMCPNHRNILQSDMKLCPSCGRQLYPAHFKTDLNGVVVHYMQNECLHVSKYRPSKRLGFSPIVTCWMKANTLTAQDEYINDLYTGKRPPKGILMVNTSNYESLRKSWDDMIDRVKQDPHLPGILGITSGPQGTGGKFAEFFDFMKSLEELQYIEQREEFRKVIGAVYGVLPVFHGDVSSSGGMNNESQQITVTNRALEYGQKIYNDKIFPFIMQAYRAEHLTLRLKPSEEQDIKAKLERQKMCLENAKLAVSLGLEAEYDEDSGECKIYSGPIKEQQDPMMGGQPGMPEPAAGQDPNQDVSGEPEKPDFAETFGLKKSAIPQGAIYLGSRPLPEGYQEVRSDRGTRYAVRGAKTKQKPNKDEEYSDKDMAFIGRLRSQGMSRDEAEKQLMEHNKGNKGKEDIGGMIDNLSTEWGDCKANSDKLKETFGGTSRAITTIKDGEILNNDGHFIYIDPKEEYVVDAVIQNKPELYDMVRESELQPNVFDKEGYFNSLGVDKTIDEMQNKDEKLYTEEDIQFIGRLRSEGVSREEAEKRLHERNKSSEQKKNKI